MRNSQVSSRLKGLAVLAAMMVPGLAGATVTIYTVPTIANLINQGTFCDGTGINRYNGCVGNHGFTWTSAIPAADAINSVLIEFINGVECAANATVRTTTLNAAVAGNWTTSATDCFCVPQLKLKSVNVAATGLTAYVKTGVNTFMTTNVTTCSGYSPGAPLGGNYARITVDHGVASACATPGQVSAIESKLDDGTRWTNDSETAALRTALLTPINRLETKLDDGTRFTSDTERNAQTQSILTPIAALEAKADDLAGETTTTQRLLIENSLLNIDRTSILYLPAQCGGELEVVRSIVADVITKNQACNINVGNAPNDLAAGDIKYANGDWKGAFDDWRRAYRTVTQG